MSKKKVFRTNLIIGFIILVGFVITSVISYYSNTSIFRKDIENVANLTSEGIYYQVKSIFTKPVNISLTMAKDTLLREFLEQETEQEDAAFTEKLQQYLANYRKTYQYDSVFLVSAKTDRYYNFNGLNRVLKEGDAENVWYYTMLESEEDCSLNVDNDEAAENEITVFVNCKVKAEDGTVLGIVGVGLRIGELQALLQSYEERMGVAAYLIGQDGIIELSTDKTGYQRINLFSVCDYPELRSQILACRNSETAENYWYPNEGGSTYLAVRYIPEMSWILLVENSMDQINRHITGEFLLRMLTVCGIIALTLTLVTLFSRRLVKQIVELTVKREQEYQDTFKKATEQLYDNIYELNITNNCAADAKTEEYFESLGMSGKTPYDQALLIIAQKQIKEEFRQGYIDVFCPENVLRNYLGGTSSLRYDFMMSEDGKTYFWIRITAYIYSWKGDGTIRMFTYRQNINEEKLLEVQMLEKAHRDSLTKLFNKEATEENIRQRLEQEPGERFAFFILDVDEFKMVNDTNGHAFGDVVLQRVARILEKNFRKDDILGRIGGDEFVAFFRAGELEAIRKKADELCRALNTKIVSGKKSYEIAVSIGVAVAPFHGRSFQALYRKADEALYKRKDAGRNGVTMYGE